MIRRVSACAALLLAMTTRVWAQPANEKPIAAVDETSTPLYLQEPHDLIVVKGKGKQSHKILPVALPNRKVPEVRSPNATIIVRFLDDPNNEYDIQWRHIDDLVLFEYRVLAEANQLVTAGKFDEAFEQFTFLRQAYPTLEPLQPALEGFLQGEARREVDRKHPRAALSLLNDLHALNPSRTGLADDLAAAMEPLVDEYLRKDDVRSARTLIAGFIGKYPNHAAVRRWRERFAKEADERVAAANKAIAEKRWSDARRDARAAVGRRPDLAAARDVFTQLGDRDTEVNCIVRSPPRTRVSLVAVEWMMSAAVRRDNRLLQRSLIELTGITANGGAYLPLVGTLDKSDSGRIIWQLATDGPVTGYDLARRLLSLTDSRGGAFSPAWSSVVAGIEVRNVFEVNTELKFPHLLPEALLNTPLNATGDSLHPPGAEITQPYIVARQSPTSVDYQAFAGYRQRQEQSPIEIRQTWMANEQDATAAMLREDADVMDHVDPWELPDWRSRSEFAVEPYRVPTVHALVFNRFTPLTQSRSFRRALDYGLDRQKILDQLILRGNKAAGCEVISGPFPRGLSADDPLGYAVNPLIKPRPYDPELAATLIAVSQPAADSTVATDSAGDSTEVRESALRPLKLVHPSTPVARLAARAIERSWHALGVAVDLVELPPGEVGLGTTFDVLYVEALVTEPLVDSQIFFAPGGVASGRPYVSQAVEQLARVTDWTEARRVLRQIHQLVHDEVAVLPLWQLSDHYVRNRRLENLGNRPLSLYQNVEQWRITPRLPSAEDTFWPASSR